MTPAQLMAAVAAASGVAGTWEVLAAVERGRVAAWWRAVVRPLARSRTEGRLPSAPERRRLAVVASGCLLAGGWIAGGPAAAAMAAVGGPALTGAALTARRRAYRARVAAGAAPAARALAATLAAGRSVRGAIPEAAAAIDGPAGVELRRAAGALDAGHPTETVLEALRRRAGSPAWDTLVAAVLLQRDAGGDLPGLLRDLAASLEAAGRADRDAKAATAQARFTAGLVAALPLIAVALAELAGPGFVAGLLTNPLSAVLVVLAGALQAVAFVAVRAITRRLAAP